MQPMSESIDDRVHSLRFLMSAGLMSVPLRCDEALAQRVVIVPGQPVRLERVSLPLKRRQQREKALPYALEEGLADSLERTHFALAAGLGGDDDLAAIVSRAQMAAWVDTISRPG